MPELARHHDQHTTSTSTKTNALNNTETTPNDSQNQTQQRQEPLRATAELRSTGDGNDDGDIANEWLVAAAALNS